MAGRIYAVGDPITFVFFFSHNVSSVYTISCFTLSYLIVFQVRNGGV